MPTASILMHWLDGWGGGIIYPESKTRFVGSDVGEYALVASDVLDEVFSGASQVIELVGTDVVRATFSGTDVRGSSLPGSV